MKTIAKKAGIALGAIGIAASGMLISGGPAQASGIEPDRPNNVIDYWPIGGTEAWNYFDGYLACLNKLKTIPAENSNGTRNRVYEGCEHHPNDGNDFYRLAWADYIGG